MMLRTGNNATTTIAIMVPTGVARLRRLGVVAGLALILGIAGVAGAPAGAGATTGPCGGYDTQEAAQADFDAGLLDPELSDYDGNGIACEGLPSGGTGPTDTGPCGGYDTQEAAQADFDAGLLDPEFSDYDGNGIACEGLPTGGDAVESVVVDAVDAGAAEPTGRAGDTGTTLSGAAEVSALPNTGTGAADTGRLAVTGAHAAGSLLAIVVAVGAAVGGTVAVRSRRG